MAALLILICAMKMKNTEKKQTFKKKRFYIRLTHILGESLKQKYSLHMPVFCVFLFNSHGVGCLCHNGNIQCFINIGQQLSPTDGGWRQKLGQVGSLWTGWHRRVHWNKTKRWHINWQARISNEIWLWKLFQQQKYSQVAVNVAVGASNVTMLELCVGHVLLC